MHERARVKRDHSQGIRKISEWYSGERMLEVYNSILTEDQQVNTKPRGEHVASTVTLNDFFTDNPIYKWWLRDEESFHRAAHRDHELMNALRVTASLVDELAPKNAQKCNPEIITRALTENLTEVTQLAGPHLPRFIREEIDEGIIDEAIAEQRPLHSPTPLNDRTDQKTPQNIINRFQDRLQKLLETLSSKPTSSDTVTLTPPLSGPGTGKSMKPSTSPFNKGDVRSPALYEDQTVGRDRVWGKKDGEERAVDFYTTEKDFRNSSPFVVIQLFNRYDPKTGFLYREAEHAPYAGNIDLLRNQSLYRSKENIRMPLGRIPLSQERIHIPWMLQRPANYRSMEAYHRNTLVNISLYTAKDKTIISGEEAMHHLTRDTVGNISLSLTDLDPSIRTLLNSQQIAMEATYSEITDHEIFSENVSLLTTDDHDHSYLYPPQIQKFLELLSYESKKWGPRYKGDYNAYIFSRLANFLGNYWLTYDKLDAPKSPSDAVGFDQTERVLEHRIASCEGANLTLGTLMRQFLREDEGIAYVTGFLLDREQERNHFSATNENYHLKVMYRDRHGRTIFYDATPWDASQKNTLRSISTNYRNAKKDWIDRRSEHPIIPAEIKRPLKEKANSTWDQLSMLWQNETLERNEKFKEALHKAGIDVRKLPGYASNLSEIISPYNYVSSENGRQLLHFLINNHRLDSKYLNLISLNHTPLDGITDLEFTYPDRNPYGASMSEIKPESVVVSEGKKILLNDPMKRKEFYDTLEKIMEVGRIATEQNIGVIQEFTEHLQILEDSFQRILAQMLESVSESIPSGDVTSFLESVPFLTLLDHPIHSLHHTFYRTFQDGINGFLFPNEGINSEINIRLGSWQKNSHKRLKTIRRLLKNAPKTVSHKEREVIFSSLRFFKGIEEPVNMIDEEEQQQYLDPIDTYIYLYNNLFPKK